MTPSEAHDDAYQRDAAHEAMQLAVTRYLRRAATHCSETTHRHSVDLEYPLVNDGRVTSFLDIGHLWIDESLIHPHSVLYAYEIKPKIYSVAALIRQLHVLRSSLEMWKVKRLYADFKLGAVVPHDDPSVGDFAEMWDGDIWKWDGSRFVK